MTGCLRFLLVDRFQDLVDMLLKDAIHDFSELLDNFDIDVVDGEETGSIFDGQLGKYTLIVNLFGQEEMLIVREYSSTDQLMFS